MWRSSKLADLIVPDMADYTNLTYMKMVNSYNKLVKEIEEERREVLKWRTEMSKEMNYLKAAVRNR